MGGGSGLIAMHDYEGLIAIIKGMKSKPNSR
jgi:hypothetical protein